MVICFQFNDIHTFANTDEVRTSHLSLSLNLDFERKVISGHCDISLNYLADKKKVDYLDLDSSGLVVKAVTDLSGGKLDYSIGAPSEDMGSRLHVHLPSAKPETIRIQYETVPGAAAVQWLDPQQTTSGKFPFLFTQGQSIFTRTWIPCMDSPGVRVTYDAEIRVPVGMTAVMSAAHEKGDKNQGLFRFRMEKPIPPYLIALAAGELAFKPISERTGVYAEPAVVEKAAWEFADMEKMMVAAESLYGAYRWGRWDAIVLPPSFPFGGMENPMLTFATPTLIAGDRSLVSVMAHELAHSWSGNLVTNATWADFWLNEGYTTYIERRLVELLYGPAIADMQKLLGQRDLRESVDQFNQSLPGDTILYIDLSGRHPDDGFSTIPYEKGANLLIMLETHFGREKFDAYLKTYFDTYAFKTITTEGALAFMKKVLFQDDDVLWRKLAVEEWVYQKGIPSNMVIPQSDKFDKTRAAAATFAKKGVTAGIQKDSWITDEWLDFLNSLPRKLGKKQLDKLDREFKFSQTGNSEILFAWLMVCIPSNYEPAYGALESFLTRMGRRKFLQPLYQAMHDNPKTRDMAKRIYADARGSYHPISQNTIDGIVH